MEQEAAPRVLLLDDNVEVSHMFARAFRAHGCETRALYDAETALKELKDGDFIPDVIALDVMMPNMDGAQFLAELRKDSRFEHTPVAVLTNARSDEYGKLLSELGAAVYLNKLDHELNDIVEQIVKIAIHTDEKAA